MSDQPALRQRLQEGFDVRLGLVPRDSRAGHELVDQLVPGRAPLQQRPKTGRRSTQAEVFGLLDVQDDPLVTGLPPRNPRRTDLISRRDG